ncbi:MAG: tyrosine-type recombinase/integrase [Snowella sp.]|nr:tyrosine-type recombinase/integrase [Snowella sp.]
MTSANFPVPFALLEKNLLEELLRDKRSPNTRRTYAKGLRDFFVAMTQDEPSPERIAWFLTLGRFDAIALLLRYRAGLLERGLTPATVNVRLSAVKSLVNYARKVGKCDYTLEDVESLRVETYRDTSGVSPDSFKRIADQVKRDSLKGKRDLAILRLLWDNALRRAEISSLDVEDYSPREMKLWIKGKGRLSKESIRLSVKAITFINDWLLVIGDRPPSKPLFCTVDRATFGHRLSGNAIYNIVRDTAQAAGIAKIMSPHRIRHSAITAALDATNGDARKVQKLSRHRNLNTLMIYDDNRHQHQAEVTSLLADLV